MKKIFAILSSVIIALCFTACSNDIETVIDSAKPIKLNITVGNLNNEDGTRAVKTGWETGDKIYIWYDDNKSKTPDLVIKKAASGWVEDTEATTSGNTPKTAGGVIKALYLGHLSPSDLSEKTDYFHKEFLGFPDHGYEIMMFGYPKVTDLTVYTKNRNYTFDGSTLDVTINDWTYLFNTQVVVKGLPAGSNLVMRSNQLHMAYGFYWDNETLDDISQFPYTNMFVAGQPNADGVAYYFNYSMTDNDFTIYLYDMDNDVDYFYPIGVKELNRSSDKLTSVVVKISDFIAG